MKRLIIIFIVLLAAVLLGLAIHADSGYVLITYKHFSIETTLWVMVIAILVLFTLLCLLLKILRGVTSVNRRIGIWSKERSARKARKMTNRGLCDWAEGKWGQAEKRLIKAAKHSEIPLVNYLIAARAAQGKGEYDKRDNYLRMAHNATTGAEKAAVALTQAQLQLSAGQLESALATLNHLKRVVPNHTFVMRLLQQVYVELQDWQNLQELLPEIRRYKALKPMQLLKLERKLYQELLKQEHSFDALTEMWRKISAELQNDNELLASYCQALNQSQGNELAVKILKNALKKSWDSRLIELYGLIHSADISKQITTAEVWLKIHPDDADLLLALGRLYKKQQLWNRAEQHLKACVALRNNPAAYCELGQVMETLSNKSAALDYYRQGLSQKN
ncbi:MAG: heme biosynthesis protein HemY [Gammaproteobacteria bacterium]|nr:heme biosynthesis protein HemY [Gammaproteobacteria bacterium]